MAHLTLVLTIVLFFLAAFAVAVPNEESTKEDFASDYMIEDSVRPGAIYRGPCGGRGRAATQCRAMMADGVNCIIQGCKRGNRRRSFRCTCRPA